RSSGFGGFRRHRLSRPARCRPNGPGHPRRDAGPPARLRRAGRHHVPRRGDPRDRRGRPDVRHGLHSGSAPNPAPLPFGPPPPDPPFSATLSPRGMEPAYEHTNEAHRVEVGPERLLAHRITEPLYHVPSKETFRLPLDLLAR